MTRNDSSLVIHKLDNGFIRIQLDENFVYLTKDAKTTEIRK